MQIEEILTDKVELTEARNKPQFESNFDYKSFLSARDAALEEWKAMGKDGQKIYSGEIKRLYQERALLPEETPEFTNGKNLYLLKNEVNERVGTKSPIDIILLDELSYPEPAIELLENTENTEHIRDLYRLRKKTTGNGRNAGISTDEARRLKNCMRQGRELYLSSRGGPLMVKPLTLFYSLTAYAYSIVILNNPIRFKLDNLPGSHGMNYLPEHVKAQFGGDMPLGTFSDLLVSFPTNSIRAREVDFSQSSIPSIIAFYKTRHTVSTGTLLSMVPEIRDYYKITTGRESRTHPLEISTVTDRRTTSWELQIGDGISKPPLADIQQSFPSFRISERHGKVIVTIPTAEEHVSQATIYSDIRGRLWYIENPFFPVILPEICTHFLLTSMLSNLMRYSPDHWGEILLNQVNTNISLIISKYISTFELKMPILVLRSISKFHPIVSNES
ncbi:YaaC family protein [Methyloversatilis universalis]|uniref:YaaC family protein n=1 Tax=Methyloversatilis universalis TaxID=378211 RepID=UPI0009DA3DFD|nr:YaaC family protein [Methyloversatilis universalis]